MSANRRPAALVGAAAVLAAAGIVALTASMLSNLRHAFARRHRETERERVRRALAPLLMKIDRQAWEREFGRLPDDFDREAFRRSLKLDPPLSRAIIEERDEGR